MDNTSDGEGNASKVLVKKKRMSYLERSRLTAELDRTSVECSRGPSAHRKGRKPRPSTTTARPKHAVKTIQIPPALSQIAEDIARRTRARAPIKFAFGDPSDEWEVYCSHVVAGNTRFLQLDSCTWLAEQFDLETEERLDDFPADVQLTFSKWTHISGTRQADRKEAFACSHCAQFEKFGQCVHTLLVKNRALEFLRWSPTSDPEVLVFHYEWQDSQHVDNDRSDDPFQPGRDGASFSSPLMSPEAQPTDSHPNAQPNSNSPGNLDRVSAEIPRTYKALFTVSDGVRREGRRTRHLVRFVGRSIQTPAAWMCALCTDRLCPHIEAAKQRLRTLALVPERVDGEEPFIPKQFNPLREFRQIQPDLEKHAERSVSYRPRPDIPFLLPAAERVIFDVDYSSIGPLGELAAGAMPSLDERAACRCGTLADADSSFITKPCTIYDLDRAYHASVRLRRCSSCDLFSAGPDLAALRLFNFDNKRIVTQRLIHKFDVYYSGQEGTFSAFANLLEYEYMAKDSNPPNFLPVDMFRTIWFLYVRLQQFADDGICPICQYQPHGLVIDGVTVATQCAKATGLIRPPTVPHADSPVREHVRPATRGSGFQLVSQRQLRKRCIDIIDRVLKPDVTEQRPTKHRKLVVRSSTDWALVDDPDEEDDAEVLAYTERLNVGPTQGKNNSPLQTAVKEQAKALVAHDSGLQPLAAALQFFVCNDTTDSWQKMWLRFLRQMFCEESALQVVSFNCIVDLRLFAGWKASADDASCSMLRAIVDTLRTQFPTFGVIASTCVDAEGTSDKTLLGFLQEFASWLAQRTQTVYNQLEKHRSHDGQPDASAIIQPDWRTTGQCYSRAQCRYRPRYPGIRSDGSYERNVIPNSENERDDVMCSKYYAMYGRRGYTGGLLGLWCTHGVSYGFHVIPQGEGRNDVFSAIYTWFEVAPKVIIYDFACALGPYCMLREAEYFRDTLFVIDRFHASGHKTCSAACMLSTYAEHDPRLAEFNSSVAEMGNSMLRCIRKSIRYMTESHAVLYVHRFLSIWNQRVKMKLAKSGKRSAVA